MYFICSDDKLNPVRPLSHYGAQILEGLYGFNCIGTIKQLTKEQYKSFELLRTAIKDVEIITYDELYDRIKGILSIFSREELELKKIEEKTP